MLQTTFSEKSKLIVKKRGWRPASNYPHNITADDFTHFLIAPTLVYWFEYPRNDKIRPQLLATKAGLAAVGLIALYLIVSDFILPIINLGQSISYLQALIMLTIPILIAALTAFFVIWEGILNSIAEVTRFGDREFYGDWWNANSYEEFFRKWNKIFHEFLFRHVYCEAAFKFEFSKPLTLLATIVFSAQLHQFIISMMSRTAGIFVVVFGVAQLFISRVLHFTMNQSGKNGKNITFWLTMIIGLPLIFIHYLPDGQFASI